MAYKQNINIDSDDTKGRWLQKTWAVWLLGFIGVLFNPLILMHLSGEIWQPINVICATLFIVIAFILEKPVEAKQEEKL